MKWELDWLLTMQYSATDGRVSHKLTRTIFEDFIAPEADTGVRYFVPYGSAATADFVQHWRGARVFRLRCGVFSAAAAAGRPTAPGRKPANVAADQTVSHRGTTTDRTIALGGGRDLGRRGMARADRCRDPHQRPAPRRDAISTGQPKNLGLFTYSFDRRAESDRGCQVNSAWRERGGAAHDASRYGRGVSGTTGDRTVVARTAMLHAAPSCPATKYLDVAVDQSGYLFDATTTTGAGQAWHLAPLTP